MFDFNYHSSRKRKSWRQLRREGAARRKTVVPASSPLRADEVNEPEIVCAAAEETGQT